MNELINRTQQEPLKELITLVQEIEYLMTIGASISHKVSYF